MIEIVVSEPVWQRLAGLATEGVEAGAALFLHHDRVADRYLVHELVVAEGSDCLSASRTEFTFAPQFLSRTTRIARESCRHLALFHTHPSGYPDFSSTDDETEVGLAGFMATRLGGAACFSLMMCDEVIRGRLLGTYHAVDIRKVGRYDVFFPADRATGSHDAIFDRQIRAFGEAGQAVLARMTVSIVGLGGTGSLVAQQLAHLGVGRFFLVDDDVIEATNLNRVVGASPQSVGRAKVDVARGLIASVRRAATVTSIASSVMTEEARTALCQSDCIFLCTDSHSSRAFVNEFAYQYMVPVFDLGVSISVRNGGVSAVTGRMQMLSPGLPCLWCTNAINAGTIRQELMSPDARAADPYFQGEGVHQPAVISINGTVASMAVTMMLGAFTDMPVEVRHQSYDALAGTVRKFEFASQHACGICGTNGLVALGDSHRSPLIQEPMP